MGYAQVIGPDMLRGYFKFLLSFWLSLSAGVACAGDSSSRSCLAKIGSVEISTLDLGYKIAVEQSYGNASIGAETALAALIGDALECEVGRVNGVGATPEELHAFSKHVDETSRAPEILAKVKAAFGGDKAAYERLYLAPRILNQKLRSYYSRSSEIHITARTAIEKAYAVTASGKSLPDAAKECGLEYAKFEYGGMNPAQPPELLKLVAGAEPENDPLLALLSKLAVGETNKTIVEDDIQYRVLRFLAKNGPKYSVEAICAPKRSFEEWFKEKAGTIKIEIHDPGLRKSVLEKYPGVWWVRNVK